MHVFVFDCYLVDVSYYYQLSYLVFDLKLLTFMAVEVKFSKVTYFRTIVHDTRVVHFFVLLFSCNRTIC